LDCEAFIARWTTREGGAERANYQMFLSELCDLIGVSRPDPAGIEREHNDYVFERAVRRRASDEIMSSRRIDLYKKGCFILEAKQSRLPGGRNALPGQLALIPEEPERLGRRSVARGWDAMMQNARRQAEEYVFLLDADHPAPPRPSSSPATLATPSNCSPISPAPAVLTASFPTVRDSASIWRTCAKPRHANCWPASGPIRQALILPGSPRG